MITRDAYNFTHEYLGTKEIEGPQNNEMISLAHHLTRVSVLEPKVDVDSTIPWCSSWVNLAIICSNIRRNPKGASDMIRAKGFGESVVSRCFFYACMSTRLRNIDTGVPIAEPTWSANSKSWDNWGQEVPQSEAKRGDLIRLTRDGGGHIAFLHADSIGLLTVNLLGGNQSNQVCSSNKYSTTRIVHVRRFHI